MSDNDLEVSFGANTDGVAAGTEEVKADLSSLQASVEAMAASFEALGNTIVAAMKRGSLATAEAKTGVAALAATVEETLEPITAFREAFAGIGEAILAAFAVEQIIEFAKKMGEVAEQTSHVSTALGLSVPEVQNLRGYAAQLGMSFEGLVSAVTRADRALGAANAGSSRQAAAFRSLGIDTTVARTQFELFQEVTSKFAQMPDGINKTQIATAIFGRNLQEVAPLIGLTSEKVDELNEANQAYGAVSADAQQKGMALAEAFNQNKLAGQGLNNILTSALAPAFTSMVEGINRTVQAFIASYNAGGAARQVMDFLSVSANVLVTVLDALFLGLDYVVRGFLIFNDAMQGVGKMLADLVTTGFKDLLQSLGLIGKALMDLTSGNFSGAWQDVTNGITTMAANNRRAARNVSLDWQETFASLKSNAAGAVNDTAASAAAMQKLWTPPKPGELPNTQQRSRGDGSGTKTGKEKSDLDQWRADLAEKLAAEENWNKDDLQITLAFWQSKINADDAGSKDQIAVARMVAQTRKAIYAQQHKDALADAAERLQIATGQAKEEADVAKAGLEIQQANIDAAEKSGAITAQQAVAAKAAINQQLYQLAVDEANKEYELHLSELNAEKADLHIKPDEVAKINRQIEALTAQHYQTLGTMAAQNSKTVNADTNAGLQAAAADAHGWVDPIVNAWGSGLASMERGQGSFVQTIASGFDALFASLIQKLVKFVEQWVVEHLFMTEAQRAALATQNAQQASATAVGQTMSAETAIMDIGNAAYRAAANTYASIAAIPVVGPVLAPAMAATALAAVIGFAGSIASAAGGWAQVPADQVAQIHKDEMVLPANIASPLRKAIGAGLNLGGTAAVLPAASAAAEQVRQPDKTMNASFNYAPQITNPTPDITDMLEKQGQQMRQWIRDQARDGFNPYRGR